MVRRIWVTAAAGAVLLPAWLLASDDDTRMLWDTALARHRPRPGAARASAPSRPPVYRVESRTAPRSAEDAVVGVTFWRLRQARPDDDPSTRILLLDDDTETTVEQVPERIEAGTPIKPGERVRLSVEVPRTGFLYVLDREQYADGTLGAAYVIYPNFQTPQGDNAVAAGRQVEVPDRRDRISSFRLVRSRPEHTGEVLTVLVTPQPIPDLVTNSRQPAQVTSDRLAQWEREYGMQVEHLELVGGAGRTLTEAEREAGGDKQHLLTQSDAMPQTLYRVKSRPNQPLLLRLPLKIGG